MREQERSGPEPGKTRVLIVDAHPATRKALCAAVAKQPDMVVCGEMERAIDAFRDLDGLKPEVAVVDPFSGSEGAVGLVRGFCSRHPDMCLLVFSGRDQVSHAQSMLRAGARGYVTKDADPETIVAGIRQVLKGNIFVGDDLRHRLLATRYASRPEGEGPAIETLAPRQLEVFELIGRRLSRASIAERLHISVRTVETYLSLIKQRLRLDNMSDVRAQAVHWVEGPSGHSAAPPSPSSADRTTAGKVSTSGRRRGQRKP